MNTEKLCKFGKRGIHLLFETETIRIVFEQDPESLGIELNNRRAEIRFAIETMSSLSSSLKETRRFIASLDPFIRHILVLVYFEMLDDHIKPSIILH